MKNRVFLVLKIAAVIAFYIFLYKLSITHIHQLKEYFQINGFSNIYFKTFAIATILVIPNWLLESLKWQIAIAPIESITIKTAIQGVLMGIPPSTFTPNRIGETIGRPSVLKATHRIEGGIATLYSGMSQMPIMLLCTAISSCYFAAIQTLFINESHLAKPIFGAVAAVAAAITSVLFYNPKIFIPILQKYKRTQKIADKLTFFIRYTPHLKYSILLISAARYLLYCTQHYLIINALGINIGLIDGYAAIFLIYGIISFVPRPALAELGVRCSISALVLNPFAPNPLIPAAASALLWIINILIPCIIGTFLYIPQKKHQKNFAQ
ncbi:MAG: flippase-like domain-containing protein [Bacteroidales bacterium]|nr:flippase-like domain-containing protein [Bacteroidales bacterium]